MEAVDLQKAFCPFGYMDIEWIVSLITENEFDLDEDEFFEMVEEKSIELGKPIPELDPCGILMRHVLESSQLSDDLKDECWVFQNYLDTHLQMHSPTARKIERFYKKFKKENEMNKYDEYVLGRCSDF